MKHVLGVLAVALLAGCSQVESAEPVAKQEADVEVAAPVAEADTKEEALAVLEKVAQRLQLDSRAEKLDSTWDVWLRNNENMTVQGGYQLTHVFSVAESDDPSEGPDSRLQDIFLLEQGFSLEGTADGPGESIQTFKRDGLVCKVFIEQQGDDYDEHGVLEKLVTVSCANL